MTKADRNETQSDEAANPHRCDSEQPLYWLLVDLLPSLYGNVDVPANADNVQLLDEIKRQSESALFTVHEGIQAIGVVLGTDVDERPDGTLESMGWIIQLLGNLAKALDHVKANVDFARAGGYARLRSELARLPTNTHEAA